MGKEQNLTIKYKSASALGNQRSHNQDAYAEFRVPGGYGFAVCDGINGKEGGGAIASKMAIESVKRQFRNSQFKSPQKALTNALTLANFQLYDHIQKNERFKGMGASCGIVLIIDQLVYYAYIGNVRVYFLRENTIYRLTRDHTQAQTALSEKKITEDQLETHSGYFNVDRALGFNKDVNFSVCKQPIAIEEDDMLLLTTDGLYRELTETQIADLMNNPDASVDFIADNLTRKATEAGGSDNITLSVIYAFNPASVPFTAEKTQKTESLPKYKKVPRFVWIILGIIALIALLYGINEIVFNHEQVIGENDEQKEQVIEPAEKPQSKVKEQKTVNKPEKTEKQAITPQYIPYTIAKGDNFYRLGIRFNVTVQHLERVNNVQAKRLRLGQRVRIPIKTKHIVKKGENLGLIGEKYHTPVKDLKKANQLNDANRLKEGMKLFIPLQYDDKIAE